MKDRKENNIPAEVVAAFLDGNASAQESNNIIGALPGDDGLMELFRIVQLVDAELGWMSVDGELVPLTAMAASCDEGSYCSLECEKHVLRVFNVEYDESQLLSDAVRNGWQKEDGTALHNIGRHLESKGLRVTRRYGGQLCDIIDALKIGKCVIVAVDGGELHGNREEEIEEDMLIGLFPDHAVVVMSVDEQGQVVTIYDPNSLNDEDTLSLKIFEDAWHDSRNYMVIAECVDIGK